MEWNDFPQNEREEIVRGITLLLTGHCLFGSVGAHRKAYLSSTLHHDVLENICKEVKSMFILKSVQDPKYRGIDIAPFYQGRDDVEKLEGNGGRVMINADSYFPEPLVLTG